MTSDHSGFVYEVGATPKLLVPRDLLQRLRDAADGAESYVSHFHEQHKYIEGEELLEDITRAVRDADDILAAPTPAEPSHLRNSAAALVAKLDECQPGIVGLAAFAAAHHCGYSGPTYHAEHEALRAALETPAEPSEEEVERVARAIWESSAGQNITDEGDWRDRAWGGSLVHDDGQHYPQNVPPEDLFWDEIGETFIRPGDPFFDGARLERYGKSSYLRMARAVLRALSGRVEKEVGSS